MLTIFLASNLSAKTFWTLFTFGILGLIIGICATIFFVRFRRNKKREQDTFKVVTGKYKVFRFWQYYGIIILALTGYIMAIIFLGICLGEVI